MLVISLPFGSVGRMKLLGWHWAIGVVASELLRPERTARLIWSGVSLHLAIDSPELTSATSLRVVIREAGL